MGVRTLPDIDQVNKEGVKDSMHECCRAVKTGNICTANALDIFNVF